MGNLTGTTMIVAFLSGAEDQTAHDAWRCATPRRAVSHMSSKVGWVTKTAITTRAGEDAPTRLFVGCARVSIRKGEAATYTSGDTAQIL